MFFVCFNHIYFWLSRPYYFKTVSHQIIILSLQVILQNSPSIHSRLVVLLTYCHGIISRLAYHLIQLHTIVPFWYLNIIQHFVIFDGTVKNKILWYFCCQLSEFSELYKIVTNLESYTFTLKHYILIHFVIQTVHFITC